MTPQKRCFDVVASAVGLVALFPLFVAVAMAVKLQDGGPVFFRQERVGAGGETFRLWKFRSMGPGADRSGPLLTSSGDSRVTPLGRWLRKFKLDELPQLLNVLAGDMSLVGPRPEVARYVSRYDERQRAVLSLVPGITDPASVAYRNEEEILAKAADPEEHYVTVLMPRKIEMNLEYARTATLWSDIGVIARTIRAIVG
jgi:lipopolysaccharide/colanic/teichoic acid biosynthesis glycosyltransferase